MTAHRSAFLVPIAVITTALTLTVGVAKAAQHESPATSSSTLNSSDRRADTDARHNLKAAISQIHKGERHAARDKLERAQTALLNRQSLDLGASLNPDQPLPQTQSMESIVKARAALAAHNLPQASQLATTADQELTAD